MNTTLKTLSQLFLSFFKTGAFTFGGGYAMIPLIQKETVDNKNWITNDDILEIVAIAESTPGPIAINAATFIGYRVAGFLGAFCGTIGMVLPSFTIILIISYFLRTFQENQIVEYAFQGIRAGVLALIIKALWSMYKQTSKNAISYLIMSIAFIFTAFFKVNVLFVIVICAIIGLFSSIIIERKLNK